MNVYNSNIRFLSVLLFWSKNAIANRTADIRVYQRSIVVENYGSESDDYSRYHILEVLSDLMNLRS